MKTRPLRWWPDAALDTAVAALAPAWQAWCADWDVPAAAVEACNACTSIAPAQADWHWHEAGNQGAMPVWLGVQRHDGIEAMRELLFRGSPPLSNAGERATPIASEVAAVGWRELRERLSLSLAADGVSAVFSDCASKGAAAPPDDDWQQWSGAVDLSLGVAHSRAPFRVHFSGAAADALFRNLPAAADRCVSPREPVSTLDTALDRQVVRLAAQLDGVTLDLDVFQSLRLGDVLPLQHRLEEPLHVRLRGDANEAGPAPMFCAGLLGARRNRRAVELVRAAAAA